MKKYRLFKINVHNNEFNVKDYFIDLLYSLLIYNIIILLVAIISAEHAINYYCVFMYFLSYLILTEFSKRSNEIRNIHVNFLILMNVLPFIIVITSLNSYKYSTVIASIVMYSLLKFSYKFEGEKETSKSVKMSIIGISTIFVAFMPDIHGDALTALTYVGFSTAVYYKIIELKYIIKNNIGINGN